MTASPLAGRSRWLTATSTVAVLAGVSLALVYAWVGIRFPPGSLVSLVVILLVVVVVFDTLGSSAEQRRLQTLRQLGEARVDPTPTRLLEAANEVARAPDFTFRTTLGLLALGALATAGAWALVARPPGPVVARVAFAGLAVAPLTAMLAHLAVVLRARPLLATLVAQGLPATMLYEGVAQRFVLRRRLVLYALAAVATPLLLIADVALGRARGYLEALAGAPDDVALEALRVAGTEAPVWPLLVLAALLLGQVVAGAWLAGSALGAPLQALARETERLARGEYGAPHFVAGEHESWTAAGALASLEAELAAVLGQLAQAARDIASATGTLRGTDGAPLTARDQVGALADTSQTTGELARSARDIAANAQRVSALAQHTLEAARAGSEGAEAFLAAMGQVREGNQAIADSVVRLNKRVQQVGRIIEFIDGIADKADLLALNAELEGNKAGEVGRGFSLVAAEMRRLAESVMQSTREIARLIEEIRDATNAAVMATEAGVKATDAGAGLAQKVGAGLAEIVTFANQSADAMQSISLATSQQQAGTDQLVTAMEEIVRSTEASAEASQALRTAHDSLVALASDLAATAQRVGGSR
jgi:methyl-accepting chemotaxis protein